MRPHQARMQQTTACPPLYAVILRQVPLASCLRARNNTGGFQRSQGHSKAHAVVWSRVRTRRPVFRRERRGWPEVCCSAGPLGCHGRPGRVWHTASLPSSCLRSSPLAARSRWSHHCWRHRGRPARGRHSPCLAPGQARPQQSPQPLEGPRLVHTRRSWAALRRLCCMLAEQSGLRYERSPPGSSPAFLLLLADAILTRDCARHSRYVAPSG